MTLNNLQTKNAIIKLFSSFKHKHQRKAPFLCDVLSQIKLRKKKRNTNNVVLSKTRYMYHVYTNPYYLV